MAGRNHREERARAQREREERERTAALLKRRKWLIAVGGGLVAVGLILAAVVHWMLKPLPTDVHGRLSHVRELSFVEGTQRDGGISPVCGCKEPKLDEWRGVEFAGRRVTLHLRGGFWSQWLVSSAEPSSVSLTGEENIVQATAYRVPARGFNPLDFVRSRNGNAGVSSIDVHAPTFSILTHGKLKVALSGPIPIGVWIPFPQSVVRLSATRSPFPDDPQRPRLVEQYPPQVGYWPDRRDMPRPKEPQIYPLGDFLGPNLVLWTDDPEARIMGTPFRGASGSGIVTAVVISSAIFSTRIGVTPVPGDFVIGSEGFSLGEPEGLAEMGFDSSGIGSTLELTVDQPLAQKDYRRVKGLVSEAPKKWVLADLNPEYGGRAGAEYKALEEQRFPPLPDHTGFNVSGPLERITFRSVSGDLTAGGNHVDLSGGADLDLDELEVFRNSHDEQLIPAPLSTGEEFADLDFRAHGTVRVDGIAQATVESRYAAPMRALAAILTLIGSVVGLLNAVKRRRQEKPT